MTNKKTSPLENPLSANERFLHAVAVRLDVLIEQVNSIVDHLAKQDNVAVTESKVETKEAPKEVEEEAPAPRTAPRTRTRKKK